VHPGRAETESVDSVTGGDDSFEYERFAAFNRGSG
jgi:hypothetical protein